MIDQILNRIFSELADPLTSFIVGAVVGASSVAYAILKTMPKWSERE